VINAFSGFALIGVIVLAGLAARRLVRLPENAESVLSRVVYSVFAPCLLFTGIAESDVRLLFSGKLLVSAAAMLAAFAVFVAIFWSRDGVTKILGAMSGGYTNANYIGIPVATYVLGDATLVFPIVMLQLLIITPIVLTLLQIVTTGHASARTILGGLARNPLLIGAILGTLVAISGVRVPAVLWDPVTTMGAATVPVVLLAFGMSLSGTRVLAPGPDRAPAIVAVVLKTVGMPLIAFGIAVAAGLPRDAVYTVTVLAALPTAQNIFLYARRFDAGIILVRDATFLSTVLCVPVMLLLTALFHL
jgi:malonate transporter and related proteins